MEFGFDNKTHGMKILFVGFQPYGNITYPHLKQVVKHFSSLGGEYFLFRERGYFLDECFSPGLSIKAWLRSVYTIVVISVDSIMLIGKRLLNEYDLVVAVDNFAFILASALFKNVVLWSHDFVTDDQERSSASIHRLIKSKVEACLSRKADIVIQDETRLGFFCARYMPSGQASVDAFFLPVSLLPSATYTGLAVKRIKPVLLQIGGINAWRSMSDKLLGHYQIYHADYELALHGFIDKDMVQKIRYANIVPWASSINLDAESVYKIVEKCDIGFIAYNANDHNFYYIAKASGQLVEYLRCGKPVIVMGDTDLRRLVGKENIGVAIDGIEGLSDAVKKVVSNYSVYSSNCTRLYNEEYNLDSYLNDLTEWLTKKAKK
jgi:glycosyltransferase involved in cell wall biosynthesis